MESVHSIGPMEENTMVHGKMESSMAEANIILFLEKSVLDNGLMVKELNGLMKELQSKPDDCLMFHYLKQSRKEVAISEST